MTNSKGICLFAYNSTFNYVKIANIAAALSKKFIGHPVTLITNKSSMIDVDTSAIDDIIEFDSTESNQRVFRTTHDGNTKTIEWKNLTRANIYELSPYDQTLLIDCDYLIFNDNLSKLFDTNIEFTCHRDVYDVTGMNIFNKDRRLNMYSIPMLWATVIYFRKTEFSKSVFDMMHMIKDNYEYYSLLYGFQQNPFRNDFALSIAYHSLSGYGLINTLPYKLTSLS